MSTQRWWHVAICATATVVVALLPWKDPLLSGIGLAAAISLVGGWFALGRYGERNRTASILFAILLVAIGGTLAGVSPWLSTLQIIIFPLAWVTAVTFRQAVVSNVAVAVAVGVGQVVHDGDVLQAIVVEALSLGFSLFIGVWIGRIETRSEQRQALVDELREAQQTIEALGREAGAGSERERLAREIHDTIAQDLTGIVLLAQRAARDMAGGDAEGVAARLASLEESARTALAETRALVAASASPGLGADGVGAALTRLGERFERETGVAVTVESRVSASIGRDLEVVLLRCTQEGLANIRKHANAGRVRVTLVLDAAEHSLRLHDDGDGFDPGVSTSGFGLAGMRERLALVGGTFDVASDEDGTVLTVTLPRSSS